MYWVDWGVEPKIERARLDGSERMIFVKNVKQPYVMAIDHEKSNLYWCDKGSKTIEMTSLKTPDAPRKVQNVTVIVRNVTNCYGLAVFKDHVYWTNV